MSQFIIDCLDRTMSLRDVATKYNITLDDVMEKYHEERAKYTDAEIDEVMKRVYYL